MQTLITKVLGIVVVVSLLNYCASHFFYRTSLPYTWGSAEIEAKRRHIIQHQDDINTLFIGSSKTHNQIIPRTFDSAAKANGLNINSFNFGVSGLLPLESLHIYNNLILHDSLRFKYVFLELDWIETIKLENMNSIRSYYWLNNRNYAYSMRILSGSSLTLPRLLWGYSHYSVDYIENSLNVGKINAYLKVSGNAAANDIDTLSELAGYFPLYTKLDSSESNMFEEVKSSASASTKNYQDLKKLGFSKPYLEALTETISLSRNKGINLFFVVPLQWKYFQYREIIPIIEKINNAKIISMFELYRDSSLYSTDNFADPNHLNHRGAPLYTMALFNQFLVKSSHKLAANH